MSFIIWIVFGFVVGLIARAITPGTQRMGFLATMFLGIIGSFVGGTIAQMWSNGQMVGQVSTAGFVGSVLGAVLVLFVVGRFKS